jgi:molybdate transport system ATP-binding protein
VVTMLSVNLTIRLGGPPNRNEGFDITAAFSAPAGLSILFGPSGAGKSTLLGAIAGLTKPLDGRIAVDDMVLYDAGAKINLAPHHRRVALVFQSLALFPHLSAEQNISYGMPRGGHHRDLLENARGWMEKMRIPHLWGRLPATFSGGEAQRVALARALASEPKVLLLDEPFTALDEELRRDLGREVAALSAELQIPSLLVTHDRADALALGTHGIVIRNGKIVTTGNVADVLPSAR